MADEKTNDTTKADETPKDAAPPTPPPPEKKGKKGEVDEGTKAAQIRRLYGF